jgi:hypothetical protein
MSTASATRDPLLRAPSFAIARSAAIPISSIPPRSFSTSGTSRLPGASGGVAVVELLALLLVEHAPPLSRRVHQAAGAGDVDDEALPLQVGQHVAASAGLPDVRRHAAALLPVCRWGTPPRAALCNLPPRHNFTQTYAL